MYPVGDLGHPGNLKNPILILICWNGLRKRKKRKTVWYREAIRSFPQKAFNKMGLHNFLRRSWNVPVRCATLGTIWILSYDDGIWKMFWIFFASYRCNNREAFEKTPLGEPVRAGKNFQESSSSLEGENGRDVVVVPYCTVGYRSGVYAKKLLNLGCVALTFLETQ